ncbi:extracellular calcium-sensing receptor-like [Clarias magur]|uniref:Extracellular calcium-sensing receptor-like n=1 Tax=Clarias magur TaxID=1594786 RepID=A0A8J4TIH0_CLAMG|nr:extracellular calcium-sensing receptor-like [Clarias magur]
MDSCSRYPHSLRAVMSMISGGNGTCETSRPAKLIIGDSASTQCMILSRVLSPMNLPMISYLATCMCFSNRREYPNFFRTISSDMFQARTMVQMAKRFGWTWVGAVVEENDYGLQALQAFKEETKGTGICLAFVSTIFRERLEKDVDRAVKLMQSSSARVIIVFVWDKDVEMFLTELVHRNVTGRQFLASEVWSTSSLLLNNPDLTTIAQGTLGVAVRSAPIPGFEKHLRELHPRQYPQDTILRELWERTFGCSPVLNNMVDSQSGLPPCSGKESLKDVQNSVTDVTNLRATYNMYLAVYAAAYALHSLLQCTTPNSSDPTMATGCSSPDIITAQQLLEHLTLVNFTTQLGEKFYFQDGETPAVYDIVNWQRGPGGALQYVLIGRLEGSNLIINESAISWPGNMVPVSVCTAECPQGARKVIKKGLPVCCFDCLPCAEGEFSNVTVCEVVVGATQEENCVYLDRAQHLDTVGLFKDGDVIIGALINFYMLPPTLDLSFTEEPYLQPCYEFQESTVQWAQAVVFAVDEINRNPSLLPGVRLGYRIMDSCSRYPHSLRSVMSLISGGNGTCETTRPAKIIIGEATSTQSMILSRVLSSLHVPMISYLATCVCLSNKREYPNFFRTIPSDIYQARTMAQMAKRFGWTWVGAVVEDNDYGLQAVQAFREETKGTDICLAFVSTIFRERLSKDVDRAVTVMQSSSARVIMVFAWYVDVEVFLIELVRRNVTDRQFLASEIWSTSSLLLSNPTLKTIAQGTLGVAVRSALIPGLEKHLQDLHPSRYPQDMILRVLWEKTFGCSPGQNNTIASQSGLPPCSGKETLEGVKNGVTDVSNLRATYNVYLAVYAAAYALHSLLHCTEPNSSDPTMAPNCSSPDIITAQKLLEHLNLVNFTTQLGEKFYFQDGETPAVYDIVNWQRDPGGALQYVLIGRLEGSNLIINESAISWPGNSRKVFMIHIYSSV